MKIISQFAWVFYIYVLQISDLEKFRFRKRSKEEKHPSENTKSLLFPMKIIKYFLWPKIIYGTLNLKIDCLSMSNLLGKKSAQAHLYYYCL